MTLFMDDGLFTKTCWGGSRERALWCTSAVTYIPEIDLLVHINQKKKIASKIEGKVSRVTGLCVCFASIFLISLSARICLSGITRYGVFGSSFINRRQEIKLRHQVLEGDKVWTLSQCFVNQFSDNYLLCRSMKFPSLLFQSSLCAWRYLKHGKVSDSHRAQFCRFSLKYLELFIPFQKYQNIVFGTASLTTPTLIKTHPSRVRLIAASYLLSEMFQNYWTLSMAIILKFNCKQYLGGCNHELNVLLAKPDLNITLP